MFSSRLTSPNAVRIPMSSYALSAGGHPKSGMPGTAVVHVDRRGLPALHRVDQPPQHAGVQVVLLDVADARLDEDVRALEDELVQARADRELGVVVAVHEPGITKCSAEPRTRSNGPRASSSARGPAADDRRALDDQRAVRDQRPRRRARRSDRRRRACARDRHGHVRVRSGRDDHAVEHTAGTRRSPAARTSCLVDRRELAVAVDDLAVHDRRVHRAAVRREHQVRVQVRLRSRGTAA